MEDEDEFFDTASLAAYVPTANKRSLNNKEYLSLSRTTIYHSAVDLDMEMDDMSLPQENHQQDQQKLKSWRSFSKSDLCVDYILAYGDDLHHNHVNHKEKREYFERRLEEVGLILEREAHQKINFVKIHAPKDVLCQYAEILKLRLPIKDDSNDKRNSNFFNSICNKVLDVCAVRLDKTKFPSRKYVLSAIFSKEKDYLFDIDSPNFFMPSCRIAVVDYILQREKFTDEEQDKGMRKLLSERVYKAAYPLHDGDLCTEGSNRKLLYDEWASISKCIKYQPIDEIKEYFGVKFALYFSWLGFYTHMLIPASLIGLCCVIYGLATLKDDSISKSICNSTTIMCPLCDKNCDYWKLSGTCTYSKIVHVIDNPATILFAVFMSFWSALYLELWKRYSAEVTHGWGLTGFDVQCEPPRPEYLTRLASAKKRKINVVSQLSEPVVPFWRIKLPSIILSFAVAIFWVFLAVAIVFGVVIYRMSLLASDHLYGTGTSYSEYVIPITGGTLNLICITVLNYFYNYLAQWLTEMELQRTQSQYDDSLTLKIYMFQFVNYYSCISYIAFLKGKFVGYPAKYNRVFGYRQEECNPGGCLVELTIQLAIIMIGKQALNAFLEMFIPFVQKLYNSFKVQAGLKTLKSSDELISCNQWTEDYKLTDIEPQGLFHEYLEMVLQYGFVTIFVTAFPLAPLFALINNIFEMRLDAQKMIKYYRRPVPQRVKDIGVWLHIMDVLGRIAVVSNAFIIAFSSHFIPQLVYELRKDTDYDDATYLDFVLSRFNTNDFKEGIKPENSTYTNLAECRYFEYRNPPEHILKYKRPLRYWHILAARLAFVVVYQNVVGLVISLVKWTIPDISKKLNDKIQREAYRTNEIIIEHETERVRQRLSKENEPLSSRESNGNVHVEGNGIHKRSSLRNSLYHDILEDP